MEVVKILESLLNIMWFSTISTKLHQVLGFKTGPLRKNPFFIFVCQCLPRVDKLHEYKSVNKYTHKELLDSTGVLNSLRHTQYNQCILEILTGVPSFIIMKLWLFFRIQKEILYTDTDVLYFPIVVARSPTQKAFMSCLYILHFKAVYIWRVLNIQLK